MKTNEDDFTQFKKFFTEYQTRFGLTAYQIYFKAEPLDTSFARIRMTESDKVATVILNNRLPKSHQPFKNIKGNAKHEAVHLLINELEDLAWARFIHKEQIEMASEALVNKLVNLIED